MNIHEYQGKGIFRSMGVTVPEGWVAFTAEEAVKKTEELNSDVYVVKAQIHAGGRGKVGGVKIAKSLSEVGTYAKELLGRILVTHRTSPEGKEIRRLYIEEDYAIQKKYYVEFVIDRATDQVTSVVSEEGGTETEEVAVKTSEKTFKEAIDPTVGLSPSQAKRTTFNVNIPKESINKTAKFLLVLYNVLIEKGCSIVEINPLATTTDGGTLALDTKASFDDNTLSRHKDVVELHGLEEEDSKEIETSKHDLSYIALDGDIGCMVNDTGLAMTTMDMINYFGRNPANFLDAGGSATREKVTEALKIILDDGNVKSIFVSIFGGIMECNVIAEGIVETVKEVDLTLPLVVRLEGTNVELGKKILKDSGSAIEPAAAAVEGAQKVVRLVKEA